MKKEPGPLREVYEREIARLRLELRTEQSLRAREQLRLPPKTPAPTPAAQGTEAGRADLESELEQTRDTVAALMGRASKERRRWKSVLLALRKRLRKINPKLSNRLGGIEKELEDSREAQANLLVELTRAKREAKARVLAAARPARAASAPEGAADGFLALAREAYGSALVYRLERFERLAPRPDDAAEVLRLARGLRLAAEAASAVPSRADPAALLEKRLEAWSAAFSARGSTIDCAVKPSKSRVLVAPAAFRLALDELLSNAAERLPAGAELGVVAGELPGGGYAIAFSDDGPGLPEAWLAAPFPREPRPGLGRPGLGLTLVRELVRRWGGDLSVYGAPSGKGARLTLKLAASRA
jgi:signal transduction histidine kinase